MQMSLTESAALKIKELAIAEGNPELMFRISIAGGGCSGFKYAFALDDSQNEDDVIIEAFGSKLIVDQMSLSYLQGSELDYVEDLMGASFALRNPNAASTCGCGSSFSV